MPAASGMSGGSLSAGGGGGKTGGSVPGLSSLNLGSGAGKTGGPTPIGTAQINQVLNKPMPGQAGPAGSSTPQPILSPTVPTWGTNTNGGFL